MADEPVTEALSGSTAITAITIGAGWYAIYVDAEGEARCLALALWALIDGDVHGLVAYEGHIVCADEVSGFRDYTDDPVGWVRARDEEDDDAQASYEVPPVQGHSSATR